MRRSLPAALQSTPKTSIPAPLPRTEEGSCLSVELDLDCVTPVIGGGVAPYEPDRIDLVRVPGIRGQLRAFWRAIEPSPVSAKQLFEQEIAIWGGVTDDKACRSRVEITVEVHPARKGREVPAGWHEPRAKGGFSALPRWSGDRALGYALFPLQRPRKDLDAATGNMPRIPTRSLREALGFTLRLRVAPHMKDGQEVPFAARDADRLLGALFCWVYLGGLGGRTTRGFGALALRAEAKIESSEPALRNGTEAWTRLFRGPARAEDVGRWLREGLERAGADGHASFPWPTLHGVELLAGPPQSSAEAAHALLLAELQTFRQGERIGREPGQARGRPGRSRWPEPDVLRRLREDGQELFWEHKPREPRAENYAPRAAFGLPIVVSFKDPGDAKANATLGLAGKGGEKMGSRWTSPLRLRPLRCADGRWVPLVVALSRRPGGDGERVRIGFKTGAPTEKLIEVPIRGDAGARPPIAGHLAKCNGDAVGAFLDWLDVGRRFTRVGGRA